MKDSSPGRSALRRTGPGTRTGSHHTAGQGPTEQRFQVLRDLDEPLHTVDAGLDAHVAEHVGELLGGHVPRPARSEGRAPDPAHAPAELVAPELHGRPDLGHPGPSPAAEMQLDAEPRHVLTSSPPPAPPPD